MESEGLWRSVYCTASYVLAMSIEESLNKAGYETKTRGDDKGMKHILVLRSAYRDALQLLATDPKHGEIFNGTTTKK